MDERRELINILQSIAKELNTNTVPRHEFLRRSKISERKIMTLFDSYNNFVIEAGLTPSRFPSSDNSYNDDEILDEVVRIIRLYDSRLTKIYFEQHGNVSVSVCERRFGGWINTIRMASERLDPHKDQAILEKVNSYMADNIPLKRQERTAPSPSAGAATADATDPNPMIQQGASYCIAPSASSNIYGDFINFRGLQHAPVNEQGVVFLFGMICRELGYVVEIVRSGFPDCEAKRKLRGKSNMWQRVRIEFEFQSRNFRQHGHDPDQCDLIVCWEDNWPECPIELLELRSVLASLPATT